MTIIAHALRDRLPNTDVHCNQIRSIVVVTHAQSYPFQLTAGSSTKNESKVKTQYVPFNRLFDIWPIFVKKNIDHFLLLIQAKQFYSFEIVNTSNLYWKKIIRRDIGKFYFLD